MQTRPESPKDKALNNNENKSAYNPKEDPCLVGMTRSLSKPITELMQDFLDEKENADTLLLNRFFYGLNHDCEIMKKQIDRFKHEMEQSPEKTSLKLILVGMCQERAGDIQDAIGSYKAAEIVDQVPNQQYLKARSTAFYLMSQIAHHLEKQHESQAHKWLKTAAELGSIHAQVKLYALEGAIIDSLNDETRRKINKAKKAYQLGAKFQCVETFKQLAYFYYPLLERLSLSDPIEGYPDAKSCIMAAIMCGDARLIEDIENRDPIPERTIWYYHQALKYHRDHWLEYIWKNRKIRYDDVMVKRIFADTQLDTDPTINLALKGKPEESQHFSDALSSTFAEKKDREQAEIQAIQAETQAIKAELQAKETKIQVLKAEVRAREAEAQANKTRIKNIQDILQELSSKMSELSEEEKKHVAAALTKNIRITPDRKRDPSHGNPNAIKTVSITPKGPTHKNPKAVRTVSVVEESDNKEKPPSATTDEILDLISDLPLRAKVNKKLQIVTSENTATHHVVTKPPSQNKGLSEVNPKKGLRKFLRKQDPAGYHQEKYKDQLTETENKWREFQAIVSRETQKNKKLVEAENKKTIQDILDKYHAKKLYDGSYLVTLPERNTLHVAQQEILDFDAALNHDPNCHVDSCELCLHRNHFISDTKCTNRKAKIELTITEALKALKVTFPGVLAIPDEFRKTNKLNKKRIPIDKKFIDAFKQEFNQLSDTEIENLTSDIVQEKLWAFIVKQNKAVHQTSLSEEKGTPNPASEEPLDCAALESKVNKEAEEYLQRKQTLLSLLQQIKPEHEELCGKRFTADKRAKIADAANTEPYLKKWAELKKKYADKLISDADFKQEANVICYNLCSQKNIWQGHIDKLEAIIQAIKEAEKNKAAPEAELVTTTPAPTPEQPAAAPDAQPAAARPRPAAKSASSQSSGKPKYLSPFQVFKAPTARPAVKPADEKLNSTDYLNTAADHLLSIAVIWHDIDFAAKRGEDEPNALRIVRQYSLLYHFFYCFSALEHFSQSETSHAAKSFKDLEQIAEMLSCKGALYADYDQIKKLAKELSEKMPKQLLAVRKEHLNETALQPQTARAILAVQQLGSDFHDPFPADVIGSAFYKKLQRFHREVHLSNPSTSEEKVALPTPPIEAISDSHSWQVALREIIPAIRLVIEGIRSKEGQHSCPRMEEGNRADYETFYKTFSHNLHALWMLFSLLGGMCSWENADQYLCQLYQLAAKTRPENRSRIDTLEKCKRLFKLIQASRNVFGLTQRTNIALDMTKKFNYEWAVIFYLFLIYSEHLDTNRSLMLNVNFTKAETDEFINHILPQLEEMIKQKRPSNALSATPRASTQPSALFSGARLNHEARAFAPRPSTATSGTTTSTAPPSQLKASAKPFIMPGQSR